MPTDGITVTGADQIVAGLHGLADDLVDWTTANRQAADLLATATRRSAPVRTGALRSSVTAAAGPESADVQVTVRYARPVEAMRHYFARAKQSTAAAREAIYTGKLAADVQRAQNR